MANWFSKLFSSNKKDHSDEVEKNNEPELSSSQEDFKVSEETVIKEEIQVDTEPEIKLPEEELSSEDNTQTEKKDW